LGNFTVKINGSKIRGFEKYENTKLKELTESIKVKSLKSV
jgi:hypothetical protein